MTPWTVAHQAPLSMEILQASILEWVAIPHPGDLPNPGINPRSHSLQVDSLPSVSAGKPSHMGAGALFLKNLGALGLQNPMCILQLQHNSISASHISKLVATLLDNVGRSNKLQETYCQDTDGPSQLSHQSQYCFGILE